MKVALVVFLFPIFTMTKLTSMSLNHLKDFSLDVRNETF